MKKEHSYGALLHFFNNGEMYFIIIGAKRSHGTIEYGFPKGHPDPSDTSILDNIIREVQEETGIQSDKLFLSQFDEKTPAWSISYDIINKQGQEVHKTSTYYAIEMQSIDPLTILEVPADFVDEIHDIRIVPVAKVSTLLSHDSERKLFEEWYKHHTF